MVAGRLDDGCGDVGAMSGVDEIFCCCDTAETGDLEAMVVWALGVDEKCGREIKGL